MKAATSPELYSSYDTYISIHAAREGGDQIFSVVTPVMPISIHAAREGGDYSRLLFILHRRLFQSTPPVKAATKALSIKVTIISYFNPRRP